MYSEALSVGDGKLLRGFDRVVFFSIYTTLVLVTPTRALREFFTTFFAVGACLSHVRLYVILRIKNQRPANSDLFIAAHC